MRVHSSYDGGAAAVARCGRYVRAQPIVGLGIPRAGAAPGQACGGRDRADRDALPHGRGRPPACRPGRSRRKTSTAGSPPYVAGDEDARRPVPRPGSRRPAGRGPAAAALGSRPPRPSPGVAGPAESSGAPAHPAGLRRRPVSAAAAGAREGEAGSSPASVLGRRPRPWPPRPSGAAAVRPAALSSARAARPSQRCSATAGRRCRPPGRAPTPGADDGGRGRPAPAHPAAAAARRVVRAPGAARAVRRGCSLGGEPGQHRVETRHDVAGHRLGVPGVGEQAAYPLLLGSGVRSGRSATVSPPLVGRAAGLRGVGQGRLGGRGPRGPSADRTAEAGRGSPSGCRPVTPPGASTPSRPASRARPREQRDFTVPTGAVEHRGHLGHGVALHVDQHQRRPLLGRQRGERGQHRPPPLGARRRVGGVLGDVGGGGQRAAAAVLLEVVGQRVGPRAPSRRAAGRGRR